MFILLLSIPQSSLVLGAFKLDAYMLLFALLIKRTKSFRCFFKINPFYLLLFSLFLSVIIVQSLFYPDYIIETHTRYVNYRYIDTFGSVLIERTFPDLGSVFRILVLLLFSSFYLKFLLTLNLSQFKKFTLQIMVFLAVLQVLLYIVFFYDLQSFVYPFIFMEAYDSVSNTNGLMYSFRDEMLRLSGGFSEPSMLSIFFLMNFFSFYCAISLGKSATNAELFIIFISLVVVLFTSISYTLLLGFIMLLFLLLLREKNLIGVFIISIFVMILSIEILRFFDFFDFLKLGFGSFAFRLFYSTELTDLKLMNLIFGVEFSNVYSFIPSINLILQLGVLGTFMFFILMLRFMGLMNTMFFMFLIFITPRFTDVFMYLFFSNGIFLKKHSDL